MQLQTLGACAQGVIMVLCVCVCVFPVYMVLKRFVLLVDHEHIYIGLTQGSAHTGREWSAPTTTQPFLPPLRLILPPLTLCKKC